jgi:uncharacterized small protein (DUF1192 family)
VKQSLHHPPPDIFPLQVQERHAKTIRSSIFSPFPPFGKEARATATASETSKTELSQKVSEANERVAALQIQVTTSEAQRRAAGLIMSDHERSHTRGRKWTWLLDAFGFSHSDPGCAKSHARIL